MRQYNFGDRLLMQINEGLNVLCTDHPAQRPNPASLISEPNLTNIERKESAALMRVNHSGEICAQALYQGQLILAQATIVREMLLKAAEEEKDHLAWTRERIHELNAHTSYLNPAWYVGSLMIGMLAGLIGDRWSLGFIEETEKQVAEHLESHLNRLPLKDIKSRAIVEQMRADEVQHGHVANQSGGTEPPHFIKGLMKLQAKVMTSLAYWI